MSPGARGSLVSGIGDAMLALEFAMHQPQSGSARRRWPCRRPLQAFANSRASSTVSVMSSANGQVSPDASNRRIISRTVEGAAPTRRAISRLGIPADSNLITSHTWRIASLSVGIQVPLRKAERLDRIGARRGCVTPGDPERWARSFRNRGRHRAEAAARSAHLAAMAELDRCERIHGDADGSITEKPCHDENDAFGVLAGTAATTVAGLSAKTNYLREIAAGEAWMLDEREGTALDLIESFAGSIRAIWEVQSRNVIQFSAVARVRPSAKSRSQGPPPAACPTSSSSKGPSCRPEIKGNRPSPAKIGASATRSLA
jgi:hypothetical protein